MMSSVQRLVALCSIFTIDRVVKSKISFKRTPLLMYLFSSLMTSFQKGAHEGYNLPI